VQGFDPRMITGGASGYLRQEFRELELLDEITKLKYENKLPENVIGNRRNAIIREFQEWKGTDYVPSTVHNAIKWSKNQPFDKLDDVAVSTWQMIKQKQQNTKHEKNQTSLLNFVPAKGTVAVAVSKKSKMPPKKKLSESSSYIPAEGTAPVAVSEPSKPSKKRKADELDTEVVFPEPQQKKSKVSENFDDNTLKWPLGLIWDEENYSCAYDALFTILLSVWSENPVQWKVHFKDMNATMNLLASGFYRFSQNVQTLETARNKVRHVLNQRDSAAFPNGTRGTNLGELVNQMFRSDHAIASYIHKCTICGSETEAQRDLQTCVLECNQLFEGTVSEYLKQVMSDRIPLKCTQCHGELDKITRFHKTPKLLIFSVNNSSLSIQKKFRFISGDDNIVYRLKGVAYFGEFHFTSRIFRPDKSVWFHDGITTGRQCKSEGRMGTFSNNKLMECNGKTATHFLYAIS
jgi:hypothetical protein